MIGRLHFEDGYPLNLNTDPVDLENQILKVLDENRDKVEILPARAQRYSLTPQWWTQNNFDYSVEVHPDGSGTYYVVPRTDGSMPETPAMAIDHSGTTPTRRGFIRNLPQDGWIVPPIAGPLNDRKTMGIHEIIIFIPGPSPQLV